jgi:hypothetical protein
MFALKMVSLFLRSRASDQAPITIGLAGVKLPLPPADALTQTLEARRAHVAPH